MRSMDKETFWTLCRAEAPWLTRLDFDQRWRAIWMLGQAMGAVIDIRKV